MRLLLSEGPFNVALGASLLLLLPLCFPYHVAEHFIPTLIHPLFADATLIAFSLAVPLCLDALLDTQLPRNVTIPRSLLILSQLINIVLFANALRSHPSVNLFSCIYRIRELYFTCSLLSYYVGDHYTYRKCVVATTTAVIYAAGSIIHNFAFLHGSATLELFGGILAVIALCSIVCICVAHVYHYFKHVPDSKPYGVIYVTSLGIGATTKVVALFAFSGSTDWTTKPAQYFAIQTLIGAAVTVVAASLPSRMARDDVAYTRRNFVRYISHEIRTPLNTVYLGIQLAITELSKQIDVAPIIDIMKDICDSCNASIEILNDLLLYDKVESGELKLERQIVNFKDIYDRSLKPFVVQAQQADINFTYSSPDCFPLELYNVHVEIDVSKLTQVLRNIVSNALKFTPNGGRVTVTVKSVLRSHGYGWNKLRVADISSMKYIRLEVQDTGPGISQVRDTFPALSDVLLQENQEKLFNTIIQFDAASLQHGRGSGLGLWISNAIMTAHGGVIGVSSSGVPGEGSLFYIELQQVEDIPRKASAQSVRSETVGSSKEASIDERDANPAVFRLRSVLIVDDSGFNRKMMRKALDSHCERIVEAVDGIHAIELIEQASNPFEVIFMDSIMPRMGGIEATAKIRRMGYKGVILGVTGNIGPDDVTQFMNSGANRVLPKPLQLSQVSTAIKGDIEDQM